MKHFNPFIFILCFVTTTVFAQTNDKLSAESIVEKYIAAVGGAAAFDSVQSITKEGTQNYFGIVEALKITYEKDKLLRYDAEYNGKQGYWMVSKTEGGEFFPWETQTAVKFSELNLKGLQGNLHPRDPLLNYKSDSSQLTLVGRDTVNKRTCYKIKLASKKAGIIRTYWIDEITSMVLRMEKYYIIRNKSNDKFKACDRFDYSDYRTVGSIKLPFAEKFKTYIHKSLVGEKESQFYKIEINQAVNPSLYHIDQGTEVTLSE
jgi:hypothetical protein